MTDTSGGAVTGEGVSWRQVRDAAVCAARRGWPVVPGVYRLDVLGFPDLVPLEDTEHLTPITDPQQAQQIWTRLRPPGVLLVCGHGIDALEAPPWVTYRLSALAEHGLQVPIATALPPYQWLILVATGSRRLRPELAAAAVLLHSTGEWIALPPTTLPGHPPLHWTQPPPQAHTPRLPTADEVQRVLAGKRRTTYPRGFRTWTR
ncbi:MAG: bifunctional DNA primase/polymerase [Pseudonocardiales bacterium]|nr:bifunctional DNA primase/polymerase [Pseudonocardiales bacterium]